jgi:5-oxoprolinase (ATP-hydrolysing) subunit A
MTMQMDLNADLGEGLGDDAALLGVVTSANVACGGHAGDDATMRQTLGLAMAGHVRVGAHPGYADRVGFGRRIIAMTQDDIEMLVAGQVAVLVGHAAEAGTRVGYVKAHGALANLAADDADVASAVARGVRAVSGDLALLAISGTAQETAGRAVGLAVFSEVFADRAYLPNGRLVPRSDAGAMIHDADVATGRMLRFLDTGLMPTLDGGQVALAAQSICVHGDSPGAVAMAVALRRALVGAGVTLAAFV